MLSFEHELPAPAPSPPPKPDTPDIKFSSGQHGTEVWHLQVRGIKLSCRVVLCSTKDLVYCAATAAIFLPQSQPHAA